MKSLLFTADVLKAKLRVLETGEAQTRRLSGLKEINKNPGGWEISKWDGEYTYAMNGGFQFLMKPLLAVKGNLKAILPRYQVGDVVYIKEAWAAGEQWDNRKPSEISHLSAIWYPHGADLLHIPMWVGKMRSPLFMPAWVARYFAQITDVRVERLNCMTEEDAHAEGIVMNNTPWPGWYWMENVYSTDCPLLAFGMLWDSINPKQKWDTSPWVIAYTFKLVKGQR